MKTNVVRKTREYAHRSASSRVVRPRLIAYSVRRMMETGGCGMYYPSGCGKNHSGNTGPGCGHYYPSSCGENHSGN